jgi:hypothetical protein
MSAMLCAICKALVDTDDDPDSLYVPQHPNEAVCSECRDERDLPSEFEQ